MSVVSVCLDVSLSVVVVAVRTGGVRRVFLVVLCLLFVLHLVHKYLQYCLRRVVALGGLSVAVSLCHGLVCNLFVVVLVPIR